MAVCAWGDAAVYPLGRFMVEYGRVQSNAFWSAEGWQAKIHKRLSKSLPGWNGWLVDGMTIQPHLNGVATGLPVVKVVEKAACFRWFRSMRSSPYSGQTKPGSEMAFCMPTDPLGPQVFVLKIIILLSNFRTINPIFYKEAAEP